jgi:hypothetical protein
MRRYIKQNAAAATASPGHPSTRTALRDGGCRAENTDESTRRPTHTAQRTTHNAQRKPSASSPTTVTSPSNGTSRSRCGFVGTPGSWRFRRRDTPPLETAWSPWSTAQSPGRGSARRPRSPEVVSHRRRVGALRSLRHARDTAYRMRREHPAWRRATSACGKLRSRAKSKSRIATTLTPD